MSRSKLAQYRRSIRQSLIEDFNWASHQATVNVKAKHALIAECYASCFTVRFTAKYINEIRNTRSVK